MDSNKKKTATAAAAILLAAALVGGTTAYLQQASDDVQNTFTANKNAVTLTESYGNSYDIIPGTEQPKDPTVTATATVDSFVYLVVDDTTGGLVTYEIDTDAWSLLYDKGADGNTTGGTVYYAVLSMTETVAGEYGNESITYSEVQKEYNVLKDQKVSYAASLTNADMQTESTTHEEDGSTTTTYSLKDGLALSFTAYIIQQTPFEVYIESTTADTAGNAGTASSIDLLLSAKKAFPYAYYNINEAVAEEDISYISDESVLTEVFADLEEDAYIILTDDIETQDTITIAATDNVTIDLAGNTLQSNIYVKNTGNDYAQDIVITSSQDGAVLTAAEGSKSAISVLYAEIAEISNVTIDASAATDYGIYIPGSGGKISKIENVTVSGTKYGIYLEKANNAANAAVAAVGEITNCTIEGTDTGLYIFSSFVNLVEGCTITGGNYGVYLRGQETSYTTAATIVNSVLTGTNKIGLVLNDWSAQHTAIQANLTSCTLYGKTCAAQYAASGKITLSFTNCTIGESSGDYSLTTDGTGGAHTYINITASDLSSTSN